MSNHTDVTTVLPGGSAMDPPLGVFLAVARLSPDAIVVVVEAEDGLRPVWANPGVGRLLGYGSSRLLDDGLGVLAAQSLGNGDVVVDALDGDPLVALLDDQGGTADLTLRRADGSSMLSRVSAAPVRSGDALYWAVTVREIEAQVRADEHLRASEERFRALAANAPIGIFASEVGLRLGYVNDRLAELWGRPADELVGTGWLEAIHEDDVAAMVDAVARVLAGSEVDLPIRVVRRDGEQRWMRARATPVRLPGRGAGFVGSMEDVTEGRLHEEALAHQANHDPLTGLPNRSLLWHKIESSLHSRLPEDPPMALLFFDLDNFKLVNDSLGHMAGDLLLVETSSRLQSPVRPGDVVARFGGDEFVVLCNAVASEDEAVGIADRLLDALALPVTLGEDEVRITASVGVVVTADRRTVEGIVRDADVAMYQAKEGGKDRYALFDERVRSGLKDRLALVTDLRRAVEDDGLSVAYQPVVDLKTGALASVEALLRWEHPTRGQVPPSELVPLAEETGVITAVGTWMLRQSCAQLARWRAELGDGAPAYVAVNLSAHQLSRHDLPDIVANALADAGLQGSDLCLELTESVLMADAGNSVDALAALRSQGVRLAIDDFGTGYSSLAYLKRFPVELLKVDRSFVSGMADDGGDAAIVAAVVGLAQALGLAVVAEGVESAEQLGELARLGCTYAQGFHLGRPATADAMTERLRRASRRRGPIASFPSDALEEPKT